MTSRSCFIAHEKPKLKKEYSSFNQNSGTYIGQGFLNEQDVFNCIRTIGRAKILKEKICGRTYISPLLQIKQFLNFEYKHRNLRTITSEHYRALKKAQLNGEDWLIWIDSHDLLYLDIVIDLLLDMFIEPSLFTYYRIGIMNDNLEEDFKEFEYYSKKKSKIALALQ